MTEYKNQHYIPQFYLRHFSSDGVGVYRYSLKNDITERSNIEKTCSSFWFYAPSSIASEIESVLSPLEAQHAGIIQEILDTRSLGVVSPWSKDPQHSFEKYLRLCNFILLTSTRTKLAKSEAEAVANFVFDSMKPYLKQSEKVRARGITPGFIDGLRVSRDTANLEGMLGAMVGTPLISDLAVAVLINKTKNPFITSDSPTIFYNFLNLEDQDLLGWQSPGLMIFMPLSEECALWLLDPEMYKPRTKAQESIVSLTREQDVDELNRLQMLNADDYLIFSKADYHEYISSLYKPIRGRREKSLKPEKWSEFDVGDEHHEMSKLRRIKINYKPHLSFFKKDQPRVTLFVESYKKAYEEYIAKFGRTRRPPAVVRNEDLSSYFETEMKKLIKKQEGDAS
jgi:hypothetical protein